MFPLDQIEVPKAYIEGALKDCAPSLANTSLYVFGRYQMLSIMQTNEVAQTVAASLNDLHDLH
jgi:hypothetical protein